jgi:predicted MFS family arabinose efflux permease
MHDYPSTVSFLTEPEKKEATSRLKRDRSSLTDEFDMKSFWAALKDWKIWVHMLITIGVYTPLYSYSLFLLTIIRSLGYKNNTAQLLTVLPYAVACVFCIGAGYLADKYKTRGVFMIFFMCMSKVLLFDFSHPVSSELIILMAVPH